MSIGRKFESAVLLRVDHREEAARLELVPHLRWAIASLMREVPIIEHAAVHFTRAIEESLLLGGERWSACGEQLRPRGSAGEQLSIPPHGACFKRLPLGL